MEGNEMKERGIYVKDHGKSLKEDPNALKVRLNALLEVDRLRFWVEVFIALCVAGIFIRLIVM
jgi:hypothetical protein